MKKICFILSLFCLLRAGAQSFLAIPDSGAEWQEAYHDCNPPLSYSYSSTYQLVSAGDTIINNQSYFRIFSSGFGYSGQCGVPPLWVAPSASWQQTPEGFIRETGNGQVYFRSLQMTADTLLFDYNLLIPGNQFPQCYMYDSTNRTYGNGDVSRYYISSIDSVTYNNQVRRRYNFYGYNQGPNNGPPFSNLVDSGAVIEGIGSTKGLFRALPYNSGFGTSHVGFLYCYTDPGQNGYNPYSLSGGCFSFYGIAEEREGDFLFDVFPNPAQTELNMQLAANAHVLHAQVLLFNLFGQPVRNLPGVSFLPGTLVRLPLAGIPAGIYLLQLRNETGGSATRRIIIR